MRALSEDASALFGWRNLFVAIAADCSREAAERDWESWIKWGGLDTIWEEGSWILQRESFRSWAWQGWKGVQRRTEILWETCVRYCDFDEDFEPDKKISRVWKSIWEREINDRIGMPDDLGEYLGNAHVFAIAFEADFNS